MGSCPCGRKKRPAEASGKVAGASQAAREIEIDGNAEEKLTQGGKASRPAGRDASSRVVPAMDSSPSDQQEQPLNSPKDMCDNASPHKISPVGAETSTEETLLRQLLLPAAAPGTKEDHQHEATTAPLGSSAMCSEATTAPMEVFTMAASIGLDLCHEAELIWIAEELYHAELPLGWQRLRDDQARQYFHNVGSGETRWTHPLAYIFEEAAENQRKAMREGHFHNVEDEVRRVSEDQMQEAMEWTEYVDDRGDKFWWQDMHKEAKQLDPKQVATQDIHWRYLLLTKMKRRLPILAGTEVSPSCTELASAVEGLAKDLSESRAAETTFFGDRQKILRIGPCGHLVEQLQDAQGQWDGNLRLFMPSSSSRGRDLAAIHIQRIARGTIARRQLTPVMRHHKRRWKSAILIQVEVRKWFHKRHYHHVEPACSPEVMQYDNRADVKAKAREALNVALAEKDDPEDVKAKAREALNAALGEEDDTADVKAKAREALNAALGEEDDAENVKAKAREALDVALDEEDYTENAKAKAREALNAALAEEDDTADVKAKAREALDVALGEEDVTEDVKAKAKEALNAALGEEDDTENVKAKAREALNAALGEEASQENVVGERLERIRQRLKARLVEASDDGSLQSSFQTRQALFDALGASRANAPAHKEAEEELGVKSSDDKRLVAGSMQSPGNRPRSPTQPFEKDPYSPMLSMLLPEPREPPQSLMLLFHPSPYRSSQMLVEQSIEKASAATRVPRPASPELPASRFFDSMKDAIISSRQGPSEQKQPVPRTKAGRFYDVMKVRRGVVHPADDLEKSPHAKAARFFDKHRPRSAGSVFARGAEKALAVRDERQETRLLPLSQSTVSPLFPGAGKRDILTNVDVFSYFRANTVPR
jgi:hypothetical protein